MFEENRIPEELLKAIQDARKARQLDVNYSNGTGPWSPTWERLPELMQGVENDTRVQKWIRHCIRTGKLKFPDK
jgi:hypothetical protein